MHGGESKQELSGRINATVKEIAESNEGRQVSVVSHAAP